MVGEVHDRIDELKKILKDVILSMAEPEQYSEIEKLKRYSKLRQAKKIMENLPRPTLDNVKSPQAKVMVKRRDEFFKHMDAGPLNTIMRWVIDLVIMVIDYDPPYQQMATWWLVELAATLLSGEWPPRQDMTYHPWWSESGFKT
jgi:hypothetical protein